MHDIEGFDIRKAITAKNVNPATVKIICQDPLFVVDFGLAKTYIPGVGTRIWVWAVTPQHDPAEPSGQSRANICSDLYADRDALCAELTGLRPRNSVDLVFGHAVQILPRKFRLTVSLQSQGSTPKALGLILPSICVVTYDEVWRCRTQQRHSCEEW